MTGMPQTSTGNAKSVSWANVVKAPAPQYPDPVPLKASELSVGMVVQALAGVVNPCFLACLEATPLAARATDLLLHQEVAYKKSNSTEYRPCIVAENPTSDALIPKVYLMTTFGGQDITTVDEHLSHWAVPVRTTDHHPADEPFIETFPRWQCQKPYQWVIAYPFRPFNDLISRNTIYQVSRSQMDELAKLSEHKLEQWMDKHKDDDSLGFMENRRAFHSQPPTPSSGARSLDGSPSNAFNRRTVASSPKSHFVLAAGEDKRISPTASSRRGVNFAPPRQGSRPTSFVSSSPPTPLLLSTQSSSSRNSWTGGQSPSVARSPNLSSLEEFPPLGTPPSRAAPPRPPPPPAQPVADPAPDLSVDQLQAEITRYSLMSADLSEQKEQCDQKVKQLQEQLTSLSDEFGPSEFPILRTFESSVTDEDDDSLSSLGI